MPAGVIYPDRMAAQVYADEVGGSVRPVGGGYVVKTGRGPMPRVVDDLGYAHGGLASFKREPIRYSKGGAVKGKRFSGSY
tara:strand:+ start:491 stop:730 length:240 start_codon:yes stop_codon:yes gene_type:complete